MSYTVIPKSITEFQTGNNKLLDIYVWAYIKLCSNFSTGISNITQDTLSELTQIPLKTIGSSIARLKEANCLEVRTRITDGCKKRNTYHFKREIVNFAFIDNGFFYKRYEPKVAGFMLLLRSICLNNTNTILWCKTKIAQEIGIGRATTANLIDKCLKMGLIKVIPNGYEITEDCLSYTVNNHKIESQIYKVICDFCESKGSTRPIWDKNAMNVIQTKYNTLDWPSNSELSISFQLDKRCQQLPKEVTLRYFIKALGMDEQYKALMAEKSVKTQNEYAF